VALEAGADGVHVGQGDMPVAQVRELVGAEMLIGLSTHTPAEIDAACAEAPRVSGESTALLVGNNSGGADYIGVGPVHMTPTKPGRPAVGLELVRYAATHARLPFFAIGGIHAGNAASAIEAGSRRVAVVRAIAEAANPELAARSLRALLDGASQPPCFSTTAG
jgi:thiamine-phosphate pyrophosphorylase